MCTFPRGIIALGHAQAVFARRDGKVQVVVGKVSIVAAIGNGIPVGIVHIGTCKARDAQQPVAAVAIGPLTQVLEPKKRTMVRLVLTCTSHPKLKPKTKDLRQSGA